MIRNRSRQIPPAYKRIDSEKWNILLPVSEDMAKQLKDNEYIKIRFCKDDFTLTVPYSLTKKRRKLLCKPEFKNGNDPLCK